MNSDPAEKPVPDDGPGMEEASKARKVVKDEPSAVPSGSIEKKQPASEKAAQQVNSTPLHWHMLPGFLLGFFF